MKKIKKNWLLFVIFSILLSFCLPIYAAAYAASGGIEKIAEDLYL